MFPENIEKYLENIQIPLRLACTTKSGKPYLLSLWYVYKEKKFYLATPESAKVVKYIRHNPFCAFEIASDEPPYCGVRGQAKAKIIESNGIKILKILLERYLHDLEAPLAKNLLKRDIKEVSIELTPINFHSWNFTERMKFIETRKIHSCP